MKNTNGRKHRIWGLAALLFLVVCGPTWATTLIRASLETLVDDHEMILVGEVVDAFSYWNDDGSFILTDLTVVPEKVFKGEARSESVTVTVMGGTVDELTTLIVAGANLAPGNSYLLFLDRADLKAGRSVMTVREHCQGVFEFSLSDSGELRVISQANDYPLKEDSEGLTEPPGGSEGVSRGDIFEQITNLVAQGAK